jgi:hypothetical protein
VLARVIEGAPSRFKSAHTAPEADPVRGSYLPKHSLAHSLGSVWGVTSHRVHDRILPVGRDGVLQPGGTLPPLKDEELVFASSGIWAAAVLSQVLLAPLARPASTSPRWLLLRSTLPAPKRRSFSPALQCGAYIGLDPVAPEHAHRGR